MGFQVSPGVEVKEIDLTNVIPAVSTSIGGYSGYFRWGPVNQIGLVSSEKELAGKFGSPDAAHTQSFLTAASFLKYGNALKVVRAGDSTMKNASAGTFEVPSGGIEGVAIASIPSQFVGVDGTETLSITETTTSAGSGATIAPRYDVGTPTGASGYKLAAGDAVDVDSCTGGNTPAGATNFTVTVQGVDVLITITGGDNFSTATAVVASTQADVYLPSNNNSPFTITSGSDTITGGQIENTVLNAGAVTITTATAGVAVGNIITVYTTDGVTSSPSFTVIVSDADGSGAGVVPAFTLNSGVATISDFDTFPTRTTGLQAFTAAGVLIPGLLFSATYDIGGIASTADGSGYVVANTSVSFTKASVTTDVGAGNFSFDEQESEFNNASGVITINNEDAFEALNPTAGSQLPGLLFARYPGALGNSLGTYVIDAASWTAAPAAIKAQFDAAPTGTEVHVYVYDELGAITGVAGSELEKWAFLNTTVGNKLADGSNNYYKDVVNASSDYIYVGRDTAGSSTTYSFAGGLDSATPGVAVAADIVAGLEELADSEIVDVNLLFAQVDPTSSTAIASKLQTIASTRKDAVAFVSAPLSLTTSGSTAVADVISGGAGQTLARGIEGSYVVFDSTALYVYNKYADNYVYIPASGHMAGLCAKTDGIAEPWFSPAGYNRGGLLGVTKLAFNPKKAERDELYKAGINPIVSFPGQGILLFGDKTGQAKPSAFDRINVRRLFIVLEKAIATAAKYQLFELNDEFTRAMFKNMTEPFLRDVKGRRGITDFLVVCDETNNTGEVIDTNRFVADIYIKPARSINFITLNFIATRTGVEFSEIVGK